MSLREKVVNKVQDLTHQFLYDRRAIDLHDELMKRLNYVGNKVDAPNRGGCAIIAHAVKEFVERRGQKAEIIYFVTHREKIASQNNEPFSCSHAVVLYDGRYYDTEGAATEHKHKLHGDVGSPIEVSNSQSIENITKGGWNKMFNREVGVPIIDTVFNVKLADKLGLKKRDRVICMKVEKARLAFR